MTFVAVVSLTGVLQGILLIVALRRIEQSHVVANRVLSVFVLVVVLALLGRFIRDEGGAILRFYPQLILLMDTPVYAYGPLLYLYLYSLTRADGLLPGNWGLHFIPLGLHMLRQLEYYLESPAAFNERWMAGDFPYWQILLAGAIVQMGIYLGASARMVFRRKVGREEGRAALAGYMKAILVLVVLGWATRGYHWLAMITQLLPRPGSIVIDVAWILMSFIPMVLAYFAIGRHELFRLLPITRKYEGSLLSEAEVTDLQTRLLALMANEKPYLQPGLTLADLSRLLSSTPKELSRVINERSGQNFFDFVNAYRVEEFKRLAQEERYRHHTVLAIAHEAGFNSKSTFYAAFRKAGMEAPADYVRSVQRMQGA